MALSIKYHKDQAYTLPSKHLNCFLETLDSDVQIITLKDSVIKENIQFYSDTKLTKKIHWDIFKALYYLISEINDGKPLKEISPTLKSAITYGLESTDNNFLGNTPEEIYKNLIGIVRAFDNPIQLEIVDIVNSSQSGYKILIPCELLWLKQ